MSKITLNDMGKIVETFGDDKGRKISFPTMTEERIEITVKEHLDLVSLSRIVDSTVSQMFTSDGYAPEYRDVVFLKNVIEVMTDVPLPMKKTGEKDEHNKDIKIVDLAKLNDWNINNCFIDMLEEKVPLITKLKKLIDEKLEYQKQLIIHSNNTDELVDAVTTFLDSTTKTINGIGDLVGGLSVDSINEMVSKVAKDGGVDLSSLKGLLEIGKKDKDNVVNMEVKQ